MSDRKLGDGSAHWPAVPPAQDGTASDTDRFEVSPPGSGPGAIALMIVIAILVLGFAGVMVMFSHHVGGGR